MSTGFKTALAYLAAMGIVEALAIYVMDNYERVRMPEWVGYSGEASHNDYLAAERFVIAMGRESRGVETLYGEAGMPPIDGTVIMTGERWLMSPMQNQRLLDWARAGGDLIVTVGDTNHTDTIMEAVGVRLFTADTFGYYLPNDFMTEPENWVGFDEAQDAQPQVLEDDTFLPSPEGAAHDQPIVADDEGDAHGENDEGEEVDPLSDTANSADIVPVVPVREYEEPRQMVHVPGGRELYNVSPASTELVSSDPGGWQVAGANAAYAVREPYGSGSVTVVGSLYFLQNQMIGEVDHASFFWAVLASAGHSGPVWFVFGSDAPSIWSTIAKHGWPALAALSLLIVLLLWRHMPRVGSPIAPTAPVRRELIEHVDAAGRFLVDHAGGHVLVASVQKHVKRKLLMRYPQVAALPERERRGRLAELAKLSSVEVDAIYRPQVGLSRNDFVVVQKVLERLSQ